MTIIKQLDVDVIYNRLIDENHFTEDELDLLAGINGYNLETLNDACRYRYGGDIEDVLEIDTDDTDEEEGNDNLYSVIEEALNEYGILYGDIVDEENKYRIIGISYDELSEALKALDEIGLGVNQIDGKDIIVMKEDY